MPQIVKRDLPGRCCPDYDCFYTNWNRKTCRGCGADCTKCEHYKREKDARITMTKHNKRAIFRCKSDYDDLEFWAVFYRKEGELICLIKHDEVKGQQRELYSGVQTKGQAKQIFRKYIDKKLGEYYA